MYSNARCRDLGRFDVERWRMEMTRAPGFFSLRHSPPWVEIHQMPPFWSYILGASVEVAHWYEMARRDRMATWHWMALGCRFGLFFDLFWWRLYTYRNARNVCFFSHHWCRLFVGVSVYLFSVAFVQAKGIRTFVSCLQPQWWNCRWNSSYSQKTKSSLISWFCSRAYGESIFQMSSLLSTPHTKCIIWVNLRN